MVGSALSGSTQRKDCVHNPQTLNIHHQNTHEQDGLYNLNVYHQNV